MPSNVERAALHIVSALHGRSPSLHSTPLALLAARVYHSPLYRTLYSSLMLLLCGLAWFEPPSATSAAAGAPSLPLLRALDGVCLLAALCDSALQRALLGPSWRSRGWAVAKLAVAAALAANWCAALALGDGTPYYLRALRPLLLLERQRHLRKAAAQVAQSLPALLNVGAVLLALHFFFSILAVVAFNGINGQVCARQRGAVVPALGCSAFTPPGPDSAPFACKLLFTTLSEASIHLFALGAGASNFPMVMAPFTACAPASALFFVAYLLLVAVALGAAATAVSAAVSHDQLRDETVRRYARSLGGCDLAFALLTGGNLEAAAQQARALADFAPSVPLSLLFSVKKRKGGEVGAQGAAGAGAAAAAATPLPPFEPRIQQASVLSLFERLRPDLPPTIVALLMDVARSHRPAQAAEGEAGEAASSSSASEGGVSPLAAALEAARRAEHPGSAAASPPGLTRVQFRVLIMALSQLRVRQLSGCSGHAMPEEALAGEGCSRGCARGARAILQQLLGRSVIRASPAPSSRAAAEAQDADYLEGGGGEKAEAGVAKPLPLPLPLPLTLSPVSASGSSSIQVWGEVGAAGPTPPPLPPPSTACSDFFSVLLLPPSMPDLPPTAGPLRRRAAALVGSTGASLLFDACILINTIVELYRMAVEVEGASSPTAAALALFQRALLAIFCAEFLLKLTVWGPLRFLSASLGHKLDALIITSSLGAAFAEAAGALPPSVALFIFTLRSLRLVRYGQKLRLKVAERSGLSVLPGLDTSFAALLDCAPALGRLLAVAGAAVYAFTIAGQEAFCGVLSAANPAVAASAYGASSLNLAGLTFDSFPAAALTVFALLQRTVAWPVLMEGAVAGTGSLWARGYFVALQLALPALFLPLLAGLAVELFQVHRLNRLAQADELGDRGRASAAGVLDWRGLVAASGVSFQGLALAKDRGGEGVWEAMCREEVARVFKEFSRGE